MLQMWGEQSLKKLSRKFKEKFSISKIFKLILKFLQVQRKIQKPKSN